MSGSAALANMSGSPSDPSMRRLHAGPDEGTVLLDLFGTLLAFICQKCAGMEERKALYQSARSLREYAGGLDSAHILAVPTQLIPVPTQLI